MLINPLAAYALSRYNLPNQYKILLFLIATMAFPAVVTMIPNFLLLRDLGLLNTFARASIARDGKWIRHLFVKRVF